LCDDAGINIDRLFMQARAQIHPQRVAEFVFGVLRAVAAVLFVAGVLAALVFTAAAFGLAAEAGCAFAAGAGSVFAAGVCWAWAFPISIMPAANIGTT